MNFAEALQPMRDGCRMARASWPEGTYVKQVMPLRNIDAKLFPSPVIMALGKASLAGQPFKLNIPRFFVHFDESDNTMTMGWHPTPDDLYAEDWQEIGPT